MADEDIYTAATHLTRREQTLRSNNVWIYKIIIGFNLVMTLLSTILNSDSAEVLEGKGLMQIRIICYTILLTGFFITLSLIFLYDINLLSKKKPCCRPFLKLLKPIILDVSLLFGGLLYLAGDNIRVLYKYYDMKIKIGNLDIPVRNLRSYIVAFSLAFMIIARIGPLIANKIVTYHKKGTQMTLVVKFRREPDIDPAISWCDWTESQVTLSIPSGHFCDWKGGDHIKLNYDSHSDTKVHLKCQQGDNGRYVGSDVVILSFQDESRNFDRLATLEVNRHKKVTGVSPKMTFSVEDSLYCIWSAEFMIQDYDDTTQESGEQAPEGGTDVQTESKTATSSLISTYSQLLDYVVIADALYTTILDEITQQDAQTQSGIMCPPGHVWVAHAVLIFLSVMWCVTVVLVLPISFCCTHKYTLVDDINWEIAKKIFHLKLNWEVFQKMIVARQQPKSSQTSILLTIAAHCPNLIIFYIQMLLLLPPFLVCAAVVHVLYTLFRISFMSGFLAPIYILLIITAVAILFIVAIILALMAFPILYIANIVVIYIILVFILIVGHIVGCIVGLIIAAFPILYIANIVVIYIILVFILIVGHIVGCIVGLIIAALVLIYCILQCLLHLSYLRLVSTCCCIYYCCSKKIVSVIEHLNQSYFVLCMVIHSFKCPKVPVGCKDLKRLMLSGKASIAVLWGFLTLIYLPLYLIQDNSWPWVCYLGREKWSYVRYPLIVLAGTISFTPFLCQKFLERVRWLDQKCELYLTGHYEGSPTGQEEQVLDQSGLRGPDRGEEDQNGLRGPDRGEEDQNGLRGPDRGEEDQNVLGGPDRGEENQNGLRGPDRGEENQNGLREPDRSRGEEDQNELSIPDHGEEDQNELSMPYQREQPVHYQDGRELRRFDIY